MIDAVFPLLRLYRLINMNDIVRDIFLKRTGEDMLVIRNRKNAPNLYRTEYLNSCGLMVETGTTHVWKSGRS